MKNYLILSDDLITINDTIKNIIKMQELENADLIKYDLSETYLEKLIEELNTYGLFTSSKVVVAFSPIFLTGDKKRGEIIQNEDLLIEYINNPNPNNLLIIVSDKLDERKKINKLIRKEFNVIERNISINDKIKANLEDYIMDNKTISYFVNYLNNDNIRILNELEKLKLYKYPDKHIDKEDIDKICIRELDEDVFTLLNAITSKNRKKAFEIYKNLLNRGEEVTKITILVADHFRLLYKTRILLNEGYSSDIITSMFNIHPYRVKLAIETCHRYSDEKLLSYLNKLGQIDINIKTGVSANDFDFDLFLLEI
ncbi:MAG: DNA polymerase III subunit delta [bacterium]|nr:DNA polymerase III subunit delta [bacterium]